MQHSPFTFDQGAPVLSGVMVDRWAIISNVHESVTGRIHTVRLIHISFLMEVCRSSGNRGGGIAAG